MRGDAAGSEAGGHLGRAQAASPGTFVDERGQEQPLPVANDLPAVWDLVLKDIAARDKMGEARYGSRLQPHNGRDMMRDVYEEMLDAVVYMRALIYERDGR